MNCKICNLIIKNNRVLSAHLKSCHNNLSLIDYYIKYENLEIPKCPICKKDRKYRVGLHFYETCNNKECKHKNRSIKCSQRVWNEEYKQLFREKRLAYMKANPDKISWQLRNKPSWPEKIFMKALENHGWYNEFEIIREKDFFPYYADFAFMNVKVVVEIDGNQHSFRKENDIKKDKVIQEAGWRVYRVSASIIVQNVEDALKEIRKFIGNVEIKGFTSEIVTNSQRKRELKEQKKKEKTKQKRENILFYINKIEKSSIEFSKFGWVNKVSEILGITPQKVNAWMKRNMLEFYEEKCFKRKN